MKASNPHWRDRLSARMPDHLSREIDIFETEIALRKQGKVEEKLFAETRLRRGMYGQRYDNGHRYDGIKTQALSFPAAGLTKGPETMWDAPGMLRIKVPFGGLSAEQLEVTAELAEEYADGIAHVTTRQDFQLHYVHIEDGPSLMRRLAAVGITTREACGNAVRNVTACHIAGVCATESFDVTPYADAITWFLMGHPDTMDFGRKFKIAFSGCAGEACGLVGLHDMGAVAAKRTVNGVEKRGFAVYVGGGLGSVPHQAKLLSDFVPEEELLPVAQAICRVFGRLGEKKNRARARVKFVVSKIGIEEFSRLVAEERKLLKPDPRWTDYLKNLDTFKESPLRPAGSKADGNDAAWNEFLSTNVYTQKQPGYAMVTIKLPLGDITGTQLRALADLARKYAGENTVRATVEQNLVVRWISLNDLPHFYAGLKAAGLAQSGAGTITDVVSCPGTDTCKLGIASSRGLAAELASRLSKTEDPAVKDMRIKISGCFNSCGQHHVADLGFYGMSRKVGNFNVPHFQLVLGGQWTKNAGAYGLAAFPIPSKRIPEAVDRLVKRFSAEKQAGEGFRDFLSRIGKAQVKELLEDLTHVPPHEVDPSFYSDWGDPRQYSTGDMGTGECAGEIVSATDFDLAAAEREVFEAQIALEKKDAQKAGETAYSAMLKAARGLVRNQWRDCPDEASSIVAEFKKRYVDTEIFNDKFAGSKFAQYLFISHEHAGESFTLETAQHRIEEAQLYVEACFACLVKISQTPAMMAV